MRHCRGKDWWPWRHNNKSVQNETQKWKTKAKNLKEHQGAVEPLQMASYTWNVVSQGKAGYLQWGKNKCLKEKWPKFCQIEWKL